MGDHDHRHAGRSGTETAPPGGMLDPRNAGYGGKIDPDPPAPGARFRAAGAGVLTVAQLLSIADDWHRPKSFLVKADDGSFWSLVSCDPILDGIAYTGTPVRSA
jgi:hypothetical protein